MLRPVATVEESTGVKLRLFERRCSVGDRKPGTFALRLAFSRTPTFVPYAPRLMEALWRRAQVRYDQPCRASGSMATMNAEPDGHPKATETPMHHLRQGSLVQGTSFELLKGA